MRKAFVNLSKFILGGTVAALLAASAAFSADYNLRAVVGPDLNDEDYDGIVVFKDYVESRSNPKFLLISS